MINLFKYLTILLTFFVFSLSSANAKKLDLFILALQEIMDGLICMMWVGNMHKTN